MAGLLIEAEILARAEPMARLTLNQYLREGASTEAGSTLSVYAQAILAAAGHLDEEPRPSGRAPAALPTPPPPLRDRSSGDRLWSRVPAGVPEALARAKQAGLRLVVVSNSDGGIDK